MRWSHLRHWKTSNHTAGRFRPTLERLETRDCPAAPTLTFNASIVSGNLVSLSGTVTDEDPANVRVDFSGIITDAVYANAAGEYSLLTEVPSVGTITAQAVDQESLRSDAIDQSIASSVPSITLTRTYGPNGSVTLSGHVTDEDATAATVTFSGAVNAQVFTDDQGNFSYTTTDWNIGTVEASTVDPFAQASNVPTASLANSAPVISDFQVLAGADRFYTFQGRVTDEYAPGLRVRLTGLPTIEGVNVTVDSSGWFSLTIQLQPGETGTVMAQTWDWWNVASNQAFEFVW
jgi:hypothetical protein